MIFAELVKNLRHKCLLSQEAFAKEIGVSFATVNRWETGKTKPTFAHVTSKSIRRFLQ